MESEGLWHKCDASFVDSFYPVGKSSPSFTSMHISELKAEAQVSALKHGCAFQRWKLFLSLIGLQAI